MPPDASGHFDAVLTGSIEQTVAWDDADLTCGGTMMGAASAMLSFESGAEPDHLSFLLQLDPWDGESAATDVPCKISISGSAASEAGAYSNADCLATLSEGDQVDESNGLILLAFDGDVTCSGPADAMLGGGSVTLSAVSFRGVLGRSAR